MTTIWGHRGASAYAPENTLAAFALARTMGAHGVELDVQLTADGRLVCIHDETLDRTTDGHGWVQDHTLDEIGRLDASAGMSEYAGERVPTLDEVFELLAGTGMYVNVELKNSLRPYPGMEETVLALVDEFGMGDRVVISSFNHISLAGLRESGAQERVSGLGLLHGDVLHEPWAYAQGLGLTALHPPFAYVQYVPETVERSHALGLAVNPWTLNDVDEMRQAVELGVDAIITNFPDKGLELV